MTKNRVSQMKYLRLIGWDFNTVHPVLSLKNVCEIVINILHDYSLFIIWICFQDVIRWNENRYLDWLTNIL